MNTKEEIFIFFGLVLVGIIIYFIFRASKEAEFNNRKFFIENYQFPEKIFQQVQEKYPHLTDEHIHQVKKALCQYLIICAKARKKVVSMPSQVVDLAWHEFILFTKRYQEFCEKAFGYFLHHTPAEAMESPTHAQEGIKRAWCFSCELEEILPDRPRRLPLLFAIDTALTIPDGFSYQLDCTQNPKSGFCATHIGCGGGGSCSGGGDGGDGGSSSGGCGGGGD
ncbi:glycine-rich domain-containing protein [Spartinivicinus poritis]|uniref:Uncharacterized protein n=1 Tax=Spartinivicinus poritis TaxID=2994640 RepID=A0ABT5UGT6_9GAMM|nr:hypothetical protein [Spartinivicinus sp. A2-2]MDE1465610.1 hypothetical protein [Spartinivicinus sp. A2-2]